MDNKKLNIKELMSNLFSREHKDMKRGNDRISQLLSTLGNPHIKYPTIHVAGTNGKGSISSFMSSIFQECGYKVGLYTSPHIIDFTERIKINNKSIKYADIEKIYEKIDDVSIDIGASFFEISSAMAFEYFRQMNVDIAIIETGLGGTYDATNVIHPIMSILASITKDHTDILGNTLEEIAKDKAGIIKPNSIAVLQDKNPVVIEAMQNVAIAKDTILYLNYGIPFIDQKGYDENLNMILDVFFPENTIDILENNRSNNCLNINIEKLNYDKQLKEEINTTFKKLPYRIKVPFPGKHQIENIKTTIYSSILLMEKFNITLKGIIKGVENVRKNTDTRYRIELISKKNPYLIIDVSHNIDSIQKLVDTLKEATIYDKFDFVFGSMNDKDIEGMLKILNPVCTRLRIYQIDVLRAANIEMVENIARKIGFNNIKLYESAQELMTDIFTSNMPTVVCGSFHMVKDIEQAYLERKKMLSE